MTKKPVSHENIKDLSLEKISEICGTKERTVFFITWLKHNRNATKAYLELHPGVTEHSARVLGSNMLANINIKLIAEAYGLDTDKYFSVLRDALDAEKWNEFSGEREKDYRTIKPYHDKLGRLLGVESDSNAQMNVFGKEIKFEIVRGYDSDAIQVGEAEAIPLDEGTRFSKEVD